MNILGRTTAMEPILNWSNLFNQFGEHTMDGLSKGAIYALIALGYTLVYGVLKLINFAHSEVFMVGTFTVMGVFTTLNANADAGPFGFLFFALVALVAAALASGAVALTVERVAYRPLRKRNAPSLIFLITAIGCSLTLMEIFGFVLAYFFGPPFGRGTVSMPIILKNEELFRIFGLPITNINLIVLIASIVMMFGLDTFVNKSRLGRGVRAVA